MKPLKLLFLAALAGFFTQGATRLSVLRVHPTENADPRSDITVTFDRPVSGSLDAMVDPNTIFSIEPRIAGRLEWRDPVTLRFTPAEPLQPLASYRITIANTFNAMDGTSLQSPYVFTVNVAAVQVLAADPMGPRANPQYIAPRPIIRVLLNAAADPARLASMSWIELSAQCAGGNTRVALQSNGIRRIREDDPSLLRYTGVVTLPDGRADSLRDSRRVVELTPVSDLPRACNGTLHVPEEMRDGAATPAWTFRTYGPLRVATIVCGRGKYCPTGPAHILFTTPVTGAEVQRRVHLGPNQRFTIEDTTAVSAEWTLDARLEPRQRYNVTVDAGMVDVFGQRLAAADTRTFATTGYAPQVMYDGGRQLMERMGTHKLAVQLVNVDTVIVTTIPVPRANEAEFLSQSYGWDGPAQKLAKLAIKRRIAIPAERDKPFVAGVMIIPPNAMLPNNPSLQLVRVEYPGQGKDNISPLALIQVTDLAVHARFGIDAGVVWVTGVRDGRPRAGVNITVHDVNGRARATGITDAQGLARFSNLRSPGVRPDCRANCSTNFDGYVAAVQKDDRAVVGLNAWDEDLAAWRFDISSAWSPEQRIAAAAAVFTERGIYRPGERVYAKAIVRNGTLGSLTVLRGDSVKWVFQDREGAALKTTTSAVSAFGTADQSIVLGNDVALGTYAVEVNIKRSGTWHTMARTSYEVAEYRPPEFLVDVNADNAPRYAGDRVDASISARYLFGAPMAGAKVRWIVQHRSMSPWELEIPGTDGWTVGGYGIDDSYENTESEIASDRVDSLDAKGVLDLRITVPTPTDGKPTRAGILAVVSDANRQTVSAGTSVVVHPASFYIAARTRGTEYFWRAGTRVDVDVIAVKPDGARVTNVAVTGVIVKRDWHQVRRIRNGQLTEDGSWVTDTVARCSVRTASEPAACSFTPAQGGSYYVELTARDEKGRTAKTTIWRWAAGAGFVPWRDDSKLRVDIINDRERYAVGDTATLLIASPFTNVEAWLTVERERVLESRRIRIVAGATTVKVPITEALAPNAFVSITIVRPRTAIPGPLDDPGRPALRVGYSELRVLPAVKQMNVTIRPRQEEYRPGDTARVDIAVSDKRGVGQRSEVTLWAVDEGVLALTGYETPDPVNLLYSRRPLGVRLASNLTSVSAQIPEGAKGKRAPGGGGGLDVAGILRSRFQTTAFFLGSVVTDANGRATASAKLPDNLTTFRVMAVAVTAGDRYGSGKSSMLVTRPLVARPSLPRFVREGDKFSAGVVVNQRTGGNQPVEVEASARGIALEGSKKKNATLSGAAGKEVTFDFTAQAGDSAHFQFSARGRTEQDAVSVRIPVKPNYHPLAQTIAGAVKDTATALFTLEQDVDPARSTLEISFGSSTLAVVRGARHALRVYPYDCTEQIASNALQLIALYRAQRELGPSAANVAPATARRDIEAALRAILRRQNPNGSIGYWSSNDWSSPWLTSYATRVLLEARAAGFAVDNAALGRIAEYLARSLNTPEPPRFVARWQDSLAIRLSERAAAVDVLSRLGRPDVPTENTLVTQAAQMLWEDRVLLAEVLARRNAMAPARQLLSAAWRSVTVSGRTLTMPASAQLHYFSSSARPAARLLTATLAIDPQNAQLGALIETLVQRGRVDAAAIWNTQDYGNTVLALMAYERRRAAAPPATIRITGARGVLLTRTIAANETRDTTVSLAGLVRGNTVKLDVSSTAGPASAAATDGTPVYFYLTVREVPKSPPVRPVDRGIAVERWYERVDKNTPVTRVAAGDLVRVKLRITVPTDRYFVVLDDPLPAGLEAVDLSLRTVQPPGARFAEADVINRGADDGGDDSGWSYGAWDSGVWSAFDHKQLRDDRVIYSATWLWKGTYTATYLARATTAGTFMMPPAHAEEMYNPAVNGRTGGGRFTVTPSR